MNVEKFKYVIWANDMDRALTFYQHVFNGEIIKRSEFISEVMIAGVSIGIHSGGDGKVTWTGMSFQVFDVVQGAAEVKAAGGLLKKDPQEEDGEPPHLAMCRDPEGNEFMLTRKRS